MPPVFLFYLVWLFDTREYLNQAQAGSGFYDLINFKFSKHAGLKICLAFVGFGSASVQASGRVQA